MTEETTEGRTDPEMHDESEAQRPPEQPFPICPHCGADPLLPSFRPFNLGAVRAAIWFCTACRKAVPVFMLPAAPPRVIGPNGPAPPRIVRPM